MAFSIFVDSLMLSLRSLVGSENNSRAECDNEESKNDGSLCVRMLVFLSVKMLREFGVVPDTRFNFCFTPLVRHA